MKLITCLLFAALALPAATITIVVKNDAGTTLTTTVISVPMSTVTAMNAYRLSKVSVPAQPAIPESKDINGKVIPAVDAKPAVLRWPTVDSLWREWFSAIFREHSTMLTEFNPAIKAEQEKREAAAAEVERLKALAVQ